MREPCAALGTSLANVPIAVEWLCLSFGRDSSQSCTTSTEVQRLCWFCVFRRTLFVGRQTRASTVFVQRCLDRLAGIPRQGRDRQPQLDQFVPSLAETFYTNWEATTSRYSDPFLEPTCRIFRPAKSFAKSTFNPISDTAQKLASRASLPNQAVGPHAEVGRIVGSGRA